MLPAAPHYREEYPFTPRYAEVDGGRMHYVDEGEGPASFFALRAGRSRKREGAMLRMMFLLFTFGLLAGCGLLVSRATKEQAGDDIREAVFLHEFEGKIRYIQGGVQVYFLSVEDGADPTVDLLARFADHQPEVRGISQAETNPRDGAFDRETGEKGMIFRVDDIVWRSRDRVTVRGGYYEGIDSSTGITYRLRRREGRWTVTSSEIEWVS